MELEANVNAELVVQVEDRLPALGELGKGGAHEVGWTRRPRIEKRPGKRAREGDVGVKAEIAAGARRKLHLVDGPLLPGLRIAAHLRSREGVQRIVKDGVHRNQLALQVRRQLRDLDAVLGGGALKIVAIGLAFRRLLEVDQSRSPRPQSALPCSRATTPSRRSRRTC